MLRLVGRDTLVELFAAWASNEQEFFARCTRPWLHGFHSPDGQRWVNDRRALLAMWRQARVHLAWLAEDTPGRAYAHDPLLGAGVAARQVGPPVGRAHAPDRRQRRRPDVWLPPRRGHPGVRAASSGSRVAGRPDGRLCARDLQPPGLLGPGWCTPLAAKGRRTRSPGAGGASRATGLAMVWPPPAAELGGLPWQWCRECWAGRCISRGDHENDLMPELE